MLSLALMLTLNASAPVVFMTDFGTRDDAVAICKGVMLSVDPGLRIVDLSHDVTPYDILEGARFLAGTAPHYPAGTVFVGVVDPGVGSPRRAIVARSRAGQFFVVPDNGLVTLIDVAEVREIWVEKHLGKGISSTFHGRDVFAPIGARLAAGMLRFEGVGPPLTDPVRLQLEKATFADGVVHGSVIGIEKPYGNLITNVEGVALQSTALVLGKTYELRLGKKSLKVPFVKTFSDVALGKELLYIDSRGRLGAAVNQGSFAERHGVKPPVALEVRALK